MRDNNYEARIEALLDAEPHLKLWLEGMRGFARDAKGNTIMLGLTTAETEEFLRLNPIVNAELLYGARNRRGEPEFEKMRDRYYELREKHDAASSKDAVENLAFFTGNTKKQ